MIAYRVTLDVPRELMWFVAKLPAAERRRRGTPPGSRALTCFRQALERTRAEGFPHVILDGPVMPADRCRDKTLGVGGEHHAGVVFISPRPFRRGRQSYPENLIAVLRVLLAELPPNTRDWICWLS